MELHTAAAFSVAGVEDEQTLAVMSFQAYHHVKC